MTSEFSETGEKIEQNSKCINSVKLKIKFNLTKQKNKARAEKIGIPNQQNVAPHCLSTKAL